MTIPQLGPTSLTDLQASVRSRLDDVSAEMRRMIEEDFPLISEVNQHLLRMRGKMFRPTLVLLADQATGGPTERAATFAAVIEVIHLATLVHDDSVDHSTLRRGMPTINALFSHQVSVIMGDFLYSRAVVELVRLGNLDALRILSRVTTAMTVGEMRQLLADDPLSFGEPEYDLLIKAKTASLMSGACEVGALEAPLAQRRALASFGEKLGMIFQITDDLLDYTADETTTGKPSGLDLHEHKVTLPLIYAIPRLSPVERAELEALMRDPTPSDDAIASVVASVRAHGGLDYARDRAQRLILEAEEELALLPDTPARDILRASLGYVLERRR
ncbi:MAG: polyprenyl synthetase family protein [Gemmatimonadales bacterium]|nr:polyprenyl synthetase family protein [Gemmatimonadales bacterium]MBP9899682.1 polyprenyl synthetase family protein [Gemmatimonadales bacterium]